MGKLADLLVVRMDRPRQTPMYDPVSHLVYTTRGDDVETTIVNGKVLMRDGKVLTLNETQVLADARAAADAVRAAVARAASRAASRPSLLQDADVGKIAILLGVVQAVADDEVIFDREADVLDLHVDLCGATACSAGRRCAATSGSRARRISCR